MSGERADAASPQALAQAQALLEPHAPGLANAGAGVSALELAWALKDLCYQAFATEPPRAVRAAEALQALRAAPVPADQALEIDGLVHWTAGIAAVTQGHMAEAVASFDAASQALRSVGQADAAAQAQVPKIMALSMLGLHEPAEQCAEAAKAELHRLGNLRAAARVSLNLGSLQLRRDAYAQAASHYREAAVWFARLGDRSHSVMADCGLGDALAAMGEFDEALRIFARVRMRAADQGMPTQLAVVCESEALVHLARGHFREALLGFEEARSRHEALGLPQSLAIVEKQWGDAYLELRLLPEALALFDAAVAKFATLALPDEQAWALAQRGRAQALLGQAGASASFEQAGRLFTTQGNAVGLAQVGLASAERALAMGDATAAQAAAESAAQAFAELKHPPGRMRAELLQAQALWRLGQHTAAVARFDALAAQAQEAQQLGVQVACHTGLGVAAKESGDLTAAHAAFERAIAVFEEQRSALPSDDMRSAFLADHLRPYQELLALAASRGEGEATLVQLERFRARALDERFGQAQTGATEAALEDGLQPLRERLNWLYRRVQRLQDEGEPSAGVAAEAQRTERELLERARRHRLAAPLARGASDALDVAALRAALGPSDAIVEYGVVADELLACVVRHDAVHLCRHLAAWPQVLGAVQAVRFQMDSLRHGVAPVRQHMPVLAARARARLQQAHALVWAPLRAALAGAERVMVVPHAQLNALPFAALEDAGKPEATSALGLQVQMCMAPSARVGLRGLRGHARAPLHLLALGESSRLPHAAAEVQALVPLFQTNASRTGAEATLANLQQHAASADVLHLACHAQFRSDNPRFSALHLADGALTAEAAERLPLNACTVVLSACETGVADTAQGDEMVGLVRAFLVAGAARVLGSAWPVDDEATAAFMALFYAALVRGDGAAGALQAAQRGLRAEHAHPAFWAAFTLYGGW